MVLEIFGWGTPTYSEVFLLAAGAIIFVISASVLPDLYRDAKIIRNAHEARMVVLAADGYLRREIGRLVKGCIIVALGLWFMVNPEPLISPSRPLIERVLIIGAFVSLAVVIAAEAGMDRYYRREMKLEAKKPSKEK